VGSAEEALRVLQRESFSAILCDYRLRGMTGVQLLERLRTAGDMTPMLLLSGAPDQKDVLRAARYAQVDFFPKPFRIEELQQSLARLVSVDGKHAAAA
jgi:DNA-binding NtrC family response regulator